MYVQKLIILGGGTAGLISALILRQTYPNLDIKIIESDKIGIVGVGEGSTEHWTDFMQDCNISLQDLFTHTDCTFKYGINFKNWNGDNSNYIHSVTSSFSQESQTLSKIGYAYCIANGYSSKDIVPWYIEQNRHPEPYWGIKQFHFDTKKLNSFLHSLCEQRSIKIIKTEISDVGLSSSGEINFLEDFNGKNYYADFFVDCSGFKRFLIQKTLKANWQSYKKYLPVDSAIAFQTEIKNEIPSWTLSQAMKNGWLWQIPTQKRFGNGYVFSSEFCEVDQAVNEVEKLYNEKIQVAKEIKFEAGTLDKSWVGNCCAIGLSSSFVEPLEASSIGHSIQQSYLLAKNLASYHPDIEFSQKQFNKENNELFSNIIDFVSLHYNTKRNDSEFWKFATNLPRTDTLKEKLRLFRHKFPSIGDFPNRSVLFKESNWIMVMHGLDLINKTVAQKELSMQTSPVLESLKWNIGAPKEIHTVDHYTAIENLKK